MDNFVVTFARGFGTGGKAIASQLAKELGIHCYENRILTLASQLSGLDENVFQEVNEKLREEGDLRAFCEVFQEQRGIYREMRSSNQMTGSLSIRARLSTSLQTRNPAS